MKKLIGLIILFIIAATVLTLVQYFRHPSSNLIKSPSVATSTATSTPTLDRNPLLSEKQEDLLIKAGVDPSTLPKSITPAMESCFVSKLGAARVNAIKNGEIPTLEEIIVAKVCL
jgi:hypothetical protein